MADVDRKIRERFAVNLERARRRSGLSVEELAERTLTDEGELEAVLRGERDPEFSTIAVLAGVLGAPIDELFLGIAWIPRTASTPGRFVIEEADD